MADLPRIGSPEDRSARSIISLICYFGIALWLIVFRTGIILPDAIEDFTGFLVGARLLGTPNLYNVSANLAAQSTMTGKSFAGVIFVRPPFCAAAFAPFLHLPYFYAVIVWKLLMITALVSSAVLFPMVPRRWIALALCWSLPAAMAVWRANDAPVVLLAMVASVALWRHNRALLAGAMLGVCLLKFHFLLFVPLLLLQRRYWRILAGFTFVGLLLLATNFLVQPDWIRLYWQLRDMPQQNMNAMPDLMPNLYASFFWTGHSGIAIAVGICALAALLWPVCRQLPFEIALPSVLFGALLVAPHTNALDAILAIPALLVIPAFCPKVRLLAYALLSPVAACLYSLGPRGLGPFLFVSGSLLLIGYLSRAATLSERAGTVRVQLAGLRA